MNARALFGPSTLVTAAFIGPGTLTTCTRAGIVHGYQLIWALMFAGLATIVLQEMAARLGWVTGRGLGEAVRSQFTGKVSRVASFAIIISAILIGNAAYESGNLAGAVIGLQLLTGWEFPGGLVVGGLCLGLLFFGRYQWLERLLVGLVILMSLCFLATAVIAQPDWKAVLAGFTPCAVSAENYLTIMGIIGTTVVPYNLFLHASTISRKWGPDASLKEIRLETVVAVVLGILISMLIMVTAAAGRSALSNSDSIQSARDFGQVMEPYFGRFAEIMMGTGFFAAGLSSSLTAPIAAALAMKGLFGWSDSDRHPGFLLVWASIVVIGMVVSQSGVRLVSVILFAQVSNAIILPFIGVFLFRLVNLPQVMKDHRNKALSNSLGALVLMVVLLLTIASVIKLTAG